MLKITGREVITKNYLDLSADKMDFLDSFQSGFRPEHRTEMVSLLDNICGDLDKGNTFSSFWISWQFSFH